MGGPMGGPMGPMGPMMPAGPGGPVRFPMSPNMGPPSMTPNMMPPSLGPATPGMPLQNPVNISTPIGAQPAPSPIDPMRPPMWGGGPTPGPQPWGGNPLSNRFALPGSGFGGSQFTNLGALNGMRSTY